jgi:TatD DNase family protein
MSAYLVDSHCHLDRLDLNPWQGQLDGALENAKQYGIGHMLCVSISLEEYPAILDIARAHDNVSVSVGVHPNECDCKEPDADELLRLADDPKVVAIGETGLDYFRQSKNSDLEWQRDRFRQHIAAAKQCGKPLIIHTRESTEDCVRLLKEEGADEVGGVMHCFVENWEIAKQCMDLNFYISFSGIVTFKSAIELQEVATKMPMDRMLVETDSPYLAPVPYRGKTNQPAYTRLVAEHIAGLRGTTVDVVAEQTTDNFFTLFKHAKRHDSGALLAPLTD